MANPIQAASLRRKLIYLGIIAGLFTLTLLWRGNIPVPLGGQGQLLEPIAAKTIRAQQVALELRELDQGDPELIGTAAQVALPGARGLVVTILWRAAIEKQKRNEFADVETYVTMVTRLQPNFTVPWIFQSWNLSYNVSVENERLNDMYYYIARGIELLAQGERLNSKSPDMRFQIAFYYQNKFGVSDKVNTLRSLMQLSCIPPTKRSPDTFYSLDASGNRIVNAEVFRQFCVENPQLVRRLREKLDCRRPEQVVQFLADNTRVPSRFLPNSGELADPAAQFPILPRPFDEGRDEYHAGSPNIDDRFDAFLAARAWYTYAQQVVPPPPVDADGLPKPAGVIELTGKDLFKYRIPRSPALIVFRQGGPRAQTYLADRLQREGWYDAESSWKPDEFREPSSFWFKRDVLESEDVELKATDSSQLQWTKAFEMWNTHGIRNALLLSPARLIEYQRRASRVPIDSSVLTWSAEEIAARGYQQEEVEARKAMLDLEKNRSITNFSYFHAQSEAEKHPLTIQARRLFGEAERQESQAEYKKALALYGRALSTWRQVLEQFPDFHRGERVDRTDTEEQTYEKMMKMADLVLKELALPVNRVRVERVLDLTAAAFGGLYPAAGRPDLERTLAEDEALLQTVMYDPRVLRRAAEIGNAVPTLGSGLFAAVDEANRRTDGSLPPGTAALARMLAQSEFAWLKLYKVKDNPDQVWIREGPIDTVRTRLNLIKKLPPETATEPGPPPAGMPLPGAMPQRGP